SDWIEVARIDELAEMTPRVTPELGDRADRIGRERAELDRARGVARGLERRGQLDPDRGDDRADHDGGENMSSRHAPSPQKQEHGHQETPGISEDDSDEQEGGTRELFPTG